MGLLNLSSAKRESDGYFKKAKDFAFLKTPALEENFLCVLARKFGGRAIPNHLSPSGIGRKNLLTLFFKYINN
jgi:hypothetical protein